MCRQGILQRTALTLTIVFGCAALYPLFAQNSLRVNELCSVNGSVIADEDGDFEDWVELYNNGPAAIELTGHGLSDNPANPFKWVFPEVTIQPGDFLLIWASGKNRAIAGQPLHAGWKIAAEGEPLVLSDPDGNTIDSMPPVALSANISFGRSPDGGQVTAYFQEPTPGTANLSESFTEILSPVQFSASGGVYTDPFDLALLHPDPDVTIYFTTDGSIPDPMNTAGISFNYKSEFPFAVDGQFGTMLNASYQSYPYTSVIPILDRTQYTPLLSVKTSNTVLDEWLGYQLSSTTSPDFFKGTCVRAMAVKPGAIPSEVATNSYFVTPEGSGRFDLPILSVSMNEKHLFGYEDGIYTPGTEFDQWRTENPEEDANCFSEANYHRRGAAYEHECNIEYFHDNGQMADFNQRFGIRLHGGCTRAFPIKSLRVYAREKYGNSELNHPLFTDSEITRYKRFILRNAGDDQLKAYMRDPVIQEISRPLRFDKQGYQPTVLFINGEYWGIHEIRDRYDEHYIAANYDMDAEEVYMIKEPLEESESSPATEDFESFYQFVLDNDMQESTNFEEFKNRADIENFIDYNIANLFIANTDWGDRNLRAWRKNTSPTNNPTVSGHDGKWRWMMFDTDDGLGSYILGTDDLEVMVNFNVIDFIQTYNTITLFNFMDNEEFAASFVTRFADLLNSAFLPERVVPIIDSFEARIETSIEEHSDRWGYPIFDWMTISDWQDNVQVLRDFVVARPAIQRTHLRNAFGLGDDFTLQVDVSDSEHGYVKLNTIDLTTSTAGVFAPVYPWTGLYFKNLPVTLTAIPYPGYLFSHWIGVDESADSFIRPFDDDSVGVVAVFIPDSTMIPDSLVIHYWHFNGLPSGEYETVMADSSVTGLGFISYPGTGAGYMDDVNDGSELNLHFNQTEGRGLRVRNPSETRTLLFTMPTSGYENILFAYAVKRTNMGNQQQVVEYRLATDGDWQQLPDTVTTAVEYELHTFDLTQMEGVNDNPDFMIRIRFIGPNADALSGNNRFDNVSLSGIPLSIPVSASHPVTTVAFGMDVFPNPNAGSFSVVIKGVSSNTGVPVQVINSIGHTVYLKTHILSTVGIKDFHSFDIDLTKCPSGVYLLNINVGHDKISRRLVFK